MATEEWKKEVQKHEKYIKDLEEKFKSKCEQMKVMNCNYTKKNVEFYFPISCCLQLIFSSDSEQFEQP